MLWMKIYQMQSDKMIIEKREWLLTIDSKDFIKYRSFIECYGWRFYQMIAYEIKIGENRMMTLTINSEEVSERL